MIRYDDFEGTNDELSELVSCFYHELTGFRSVKARKQHTDMFGTIIECGEEYYCREVGTQFEDYVRLSAKSLRAFAEVLFRHNHGLFAAAQERLDKRREALNPASFM
ncbi:MAG: hypothetical protein KA296_04500 [Marinobacter sp.]|nr:hypothetical protein [Marinobacter sp.]